jgi:periplasmic divalent cation tolerance protein
MTRLRGLHPYQVPEIVAVPIEAADPDYLAWMRESTMPAATG